MVKQKPKVCYGTGKAGEVSHHRAPWKENVEKASVKQPYTKEHYEKPKFKTRME